MDTKLELIDSLTRVTSDNIKRNITKDFVLAKLDNQDKSAMVEMVANAYFIRELVSRLQRLEVDKYVNGKWVKAGIDPEIRVKMEKISADVFNIFLTKLQTIAILNRNVRENHLIEMILSVKENMDLLDDVSEENSGGMLAKVKRKIREKAKKAEKLDKQYDMGD